MLGSPPQFGPAARNHPARPNFLFLHARAWSCAMTGRPHLEVSPSVPRHTRLVTDRWAMQVSSTSSTKSQQNRSKSAAVGSARFRPNPHRGLDSSYKLLGPAPPSSSKRVGRTPSIISCEERRAQRKVGRKKRAAPSTFGCATALGSERV
jgi:hypothetical protein